MVQQAGGGVIKPPTLHEQIFWRFESGEWADALSVHLPPSEIPEHGLRQFRLHESRGVRPDTPDPAFLRLSGGKRGFYLLRNECYMGWDKGTDAWFGLDYWANAIADVRVFHALLDWHPSCRTLPSSIAIHGALRRAQGAERKIRKAKEALA